MATLIKTFKDGSILEYDRGQFDDWCVYLTRPNVERYAPRDFQYFKRLTEYSALFGEDKVYNDFVKIYNLTDKTLRQSVLDEIERVSASYGDKCLDVAIDFTIIYMGMIAEENKAYTKLGKRVKRLGVYQVLKKELSYNQAANFSRGKKWRELDELCKQRGF